MVSRSSRAQAGDIAGNKQVDGYIRIRIDGKDYLAHRLAWLYHHGYFPENQIDGFRDDNRIKNLREASRRCNMQNQKISCVNNSTITGVSWDAAHKKWHVQIKVNQKKY